MADDAKAKVDDLVREIRKQVGAARCMTPDSPTIAVAHLDLVRIQLDQLEQLLEEADWPQTHGR